MLIEKMSVQQHMLLQG
jgi:hypothetical protein